MRDVLTRVDVCICSAGAPHFLITKDLMANVVSARQKQLICIDISMPRNIDPAIKTLGGITLIGLDDLDKVIEGNINKRQHAVAAVQELIQRKSKEFFKAISNTTHRGEVMNTRHSYSTVAAVVCAIVMLMFSAIPAKADLKEMKKYKEAFPGATLKCINCHLDEKPKKEDGQHESNDYGKAVVKEAGGTGKTTVETYTKVGKIEDFKK